LAHKQLLFDVSSNVENDASAAQSSSSSAAAPVGRAHTFTALSEHHKTSAYYTPMKQAAPKRVAVEELVVVPRDPMPRSERRPVRAVTQPLAASQPLQQQQQQPQQQPALEDDKPVIDSRRQSVAVSPPLTRTRRGRASTLVSAEAPVQPVASPPMTRRRASTLVSAQAPAPAEAQSGPVAPAEHDNDADDESDERSPSPRRKTRSSSIAQPRGARTGPVTRRSSVVAAVAAAASDDDEDDDEDEDDEPVKLIDLKPSKSSRRTTRSSIALALDAGAQSEPEQQQQRKNSISMAELRRVARPTVLTMSDSRRVSRQSLQPLAAADQPAAADATAAAAADVVVNDAPTTRQVTVAKQTPFGILMETKTILVDRDGNEVKKAAAPAPKRKQAPTAAPIARRSSSRLSAASDVSENEAPARSDDEVSVALDSDSDDATRSRRVLRTQSDTEGVASTRSSRRLTRTMSQMGADVEVAPAIEEPAAKRRAAPTARRTTRTSIAVSADATDGTASEPESSAAGSRRMTRSSARMEPLVLEAEVPLPQTTQPIVVGPAEPPAKRAARARPEPVAEAPKPSEPIAPVAAAAPAESADDLAKANSRRRVRGVVAAFEAVAQASKQAAAPVVGAAAAPAAARGASSRRRGVAEPAAEEAPVVAPVAAPVAAPTVVVEAPIAAAVASVEERRATRSRAPVAAKPSAVEEPVAAAPKALEEEPRRARRGASRNADLATAPAPVVAAAVEVAPAARRTRAKAVEPEPAVVVAAPVAAAKRAAARPARGNRQARRRVSDEGDASVSQDSQRGDAAAVADAAPAQAPEQPEPVAVAPQEQPSVGAMAVDDHTLAGGDDDDDYSGPSESPVRLIDMSSKSLTQEPVAAPVVSEPVAEPVAVSAPAAAPIAAPAKVDAAPTPSKASLNSATMAVLSATSSVTRPKPMSMMAVLKQRLQAQGIQMEDVGTPLRHPTKDRAKPAAGRRPPSRPASRPASPKIASPAPIAVAEPMAAAAPVVDTAVPVDEDVEEEVMQVGHVEADLAVTTSIAREEALPTLVQQAPDVAPAVMHTAVRASIADDFEIHGANVQMLVTGDVSESRKRKSSGDASAEIERAASMHDDEHDDELTRVDQDIADADANEHDTGDDDNDNDDDGDDDDAREPANDSDDELDGAAPSGKQHVSSGDKPQVKRARPAEADAADPAAAAALRTADERVRLAREKRAALEKARAEEQTKRDELRRMRDERRRREAEEAERKKNEVKEQRRQRLEAKIRRKREEREVAVGAKAPTEAEAATAIARPRVADEIRKPTMPVAAAAPVATGALAPIAAAPVAAAAVLSAPVVAAPIAAAVTAKPAEPAIADMSAPLATPMVRKGPMALFGKLFGGLGSPQGTTSMAQATTAASAAAVVAASSPVRRAGPASAAAWATSSTLAANSHTASVASLPSAAQPSALPQPKVVRELQTSVSANAATAAPSASVAAKTLMPPPINYIRSPPPVNNSSPRTLAAVGTQQTAQGVSPAVESYIMSDCSEEEDSGMSPETPEKRGKKVPLWAKRDALFRALQQQNVDPDEVFGPDLAPVDLEELFGAQRARYRRRASSANWQVDGLSTQENSRYKEKLFKSGLAQVHSVAQPLQPHNK
jgi:hypothetical protein